MKRKCQSCRNAKQKCLPRSRTWDSNLQEKCERCIKSDRQCGPNEQPPRRSRTRAQTPGGCKAAQVDICLTAEGSAKCHASSTIMSGNSKVEHSKILDALLKEIDAEAIILRDNQLIVESLRTSTFQNGNNSLGEIQNATCQTMLSKLSHIEDHAEQACNAGQIKDAELAFLRVLEMYQKHPSPVRTRIHHLLLKMEDLYRKKDEPLRAADCLWDILELRHPLSQDQPNEDAVIERLVSYLLKMSNKISESLKTRTTGIFPSLHFQTPLRPVHWVIKRAKSFNSPDDDSNLPGDRSLKVHRAILLSERNVIQVIEKFPDSCFVERDILLRTPLYLAAFLALEDIGHFLLRQLTNSPQSNLYQCVNARDNSGQTVLETAIFSGCSLEFIRALLQHGAEVDPDTLLREPYTPLQAACITGNLEVVKLLFEKNAIPNRVYRGNRTPLQLAQEFNYDQIVKVISSKLMLHMSPELIPEESIEMITPEQLAENIPEKSAGD